MTTPATARSPRGCRRAPCEGVLAVSARAVRCARPADPQRRVVPGTGARNNTTTGHRRAQWGLYFNLLPVRRGKLPCRDVSAPDDLMYGSRNFGAGSTASGVLTTTSSES